MLEEREIAKAISKLASGNKSNEKEINTLETELAVIKLSNFKFYRVLTKAFLED